MWRNVFWALLWSGGAIAAWVDVWLSSPTLGISQRLVLAFLGAGALLPLGGLFARFRAAAARWRSTYAIREGWLRRWVLAGAVALALGLLPPERLQPLGGMWMGRQELLIPVWLWLAWAAFLAAFWGGQGRLFFQRLGQVWQGTWENHRWAWGVSAAVLYGGVVFVVVSGWGLRSPWELRWQGFPTPVMAQQVFGALGLVAAFWWWYTRRKEAAHRADFRLAVLLWVLGWAVWAWTTPSPNYFSTPPYPPDMQGYPASDAAHYDLAGWQAYLGYGYVAHVYARFEGMAWGHPFASKLGFMGVLALLQRLAFALGGGFALYQFLRVGLLALTMPAAYYLGRWLHSRSLGVALAMLFLWREIGAMTAARHLDAVHVKNVMSEPWLRLVLILLVAMLVKHWHGKAWYWKTFLVGVVIGWAVLIRTEGMVLLPLVLLWPLLEKKVLQLSWKAILVGGLLGVAGVFLVWSPWMWRTARLSAHWPENSKVYKTPWFFLTKANAAVAPQFHVPPTPTPTPAPTPTPSSERLPLDSFGNATLLAFQDDQPLLLDITAYKTQGFAPLPLFPPSWWHYLLEKAKRVPLVGSLLEWPRDIWLQWSANVWRNIVTSFAALPWDPRFFTPLSYTYQRPLAEQRPLLWYHWIALVVNLAILALGWSVAWRKDWRAALAPWFVYGAYLMGPAFARYGGGRFIVPMDWIPLVFYMLGWLVIAWGMWQSLGLRIPATWWALSHPEAREQASQPLARWWLLASFLLVSLSFAGVGFEAASVRYADAHVDENQPPRRRIVTKKDVVGRLDAWNAWDALHISRTEALAQLKKEKWLPVWGYAFYPKYVMGGQYCGDWCKYATPEENALFMTLLDAQGQHLLAVPLAKAPQSWQMGAEAVAIVCAKSSVTPNYQRAILVGIKDKGGVRWYLPPGKAWHCP